MSEPSYCPECGGPLRAVDDSRVCTVCAYTLSPLVEECGHQDNENPAPYEEGRQHQCSQCGAWGPIVNACGCDPNNLPTHIDKAEGVP